MESEVWDALVSCDPPRDLRSGSLTNVMSHGAVTMARVNASVPRGGLCLHPGAAGQLHNGPWDLISGRTCSTLAASTLPLLE